MNEGRFKLLDKFIIAHPEYNIDEGMVWEVINFIMDEVEHVRKD